MGWRSWFGGHGLEVMGWRSWVGGHGLEVMGWMSWVGLKPTFFSGYSAPIAADYWRASDAVGERQLLMVLVTLLLLQLRPDCLFALHLCRFSLALLDVGPLKDSYIRGNAFHDGFNSAIGVLGTSDVSLSDNVIHHTVGTSVRVAGKGNQLNHNLVVLSVSPGNAFTFWRPAAASWLYSVFSVRITSKIQCYDGQHLEYSHPILHRRDREEVQIFHKFDRKAKQCLFDQVVVVL